MQVLPPRESTQDPDLLGALAALKRAAHNATLQQTEDRSANMNLSDTIYAHARGLPADLQREALDFIAYLEQRYHITPATPATSGRLTTEAFIERIAGSVGDDFPDDIDDAGLASDAPRESLG
ncbi:selenocysteine-specific translation elongation factor [Serpentinimonas raichei]|uniref:Selenocysteine-specific translation elongation factor n=2 Tax=Serpentinimonas raichei TaxID=1458425 RepID=A0A060NJY5_9BURK|nr:selenocysteine-specific translation elongation factor [Serpentinimonas raichei]